MSGRKAQAARNDKLILEAARAVFVADPSAPIAAVAERAGVGISALYRRYPSKEDLLRKLASDGLRLYISVAEAALADEGDPWESFARFMHGIVDADTNAITRNLAGMFKPDEGLYQDAMRAYELNVRIMERTRAAEVIRPGVEIADLALIAEQLSAIKLGDEERSRELRRRYLTLILDSLRNPPATSPLPGPAPTDEELSRRWG
ncbi:TetR/AcrR family transcriptional regulator [Bailinhaonella thermotolerans]|uniref:TetR/AcrR family transcriptional regulator n=2 Tax=Bailinhaonella thermotolerans TaxID=1070861 RepID=A0A3A4AT15_9ACTN|nr:TetR/AcrR family transcriptional regulator [Bailinhaonella thermotolerans]